MDSVSSAVFCCSMAGSSVRWFVGSLDRRIVLVSQQRKGSYSCSPTAVELFPLGAGGVAGGVQLGRAAVMQRGRTWGGRSAGRRCASVRVRVCVGAWVRVVVWQRDGGGGLAEGLPWVKRRCLFGDAYACTVYYVC